MQYIFVVLFSLIVELRGAFSWILKHSVPPSSLFPRRRESYLFLSSNPSKEESNSDSPRLVILIPAYNEESRIESTLKSYQDFLLCSSSHDTTNTNYPSFRDPEIVVVDDGSKDSTLEVVQNFPAKIPIRAVALEENCGKGAALARGIRDILDASHTHSIKNFTDDTYILTQDADGSGDLIYLNIMLNKLRKLSSFEIDRMKNGTIGQGLVIGNRNYELFTPRGITRWGFQTCVRIITSNSLRVKDSQCGYKLMTLGTAKLLYENLHLKGWSHDVEVLFRANLLNIPIDEVAIDWEDKDGSKVTESGVVKVSIQMLYDVLRLRWNYSIQKSWKLDL